MDYIHWNPSLEIFSIWGVTIRWYGLLWGVGLLGSSIIVNKINKFSPLFVLDMVAFAAPFCAMMIRFGNLMNSEIIGCPTDVPWAFIFERVDMVPRHPAQLYEALFYGCVLVFGLNLSDNSVMRGRLDARRTLKDFVADLRHAKKTP